MLELIQDIIYFLSNLINDDGVSYSVLPPMAVMGIAQAGIGAVQAIGSLFGRGKNKRDMNAQEKVMEGQIDVMANNPYAKEGLALARRYGSQGLSAETVGIQQQGAARAQSGFMAGLGTMGRGAALAGAGRIGLMQQQASQNLSLQNEQARERNRGMLQNALGNQANRDDRISTMRIGLAEARYGRAAQSLANKQASLSQGISGVMSGLGTIAQAPKGTGGGFMGWGK